MDYHLTCQAPQNHNASLRLPAVEMDEEEEEDEEEEKDAEKAQTQLWGVFGERLRNTKLRALPLPGKD